MRKDIEPPGFGQWTAAVFCVSVALAAATITATFNYNFGAQLGPDFARVFLFVALLVVGLPLLANINGGWQLWQRAAWGIAIALSVLAAASHILEMQATAWTAAQAGKVKAGNHAADEAESRAALGFRAPCWEILRRACVACAIFMTHQRERYVAGGRVLRRPPWGRSPPTSGRALRPG